MTARLPKKKLISTFSFQQPGKSQAAVFSQMGLARKENEMSKIIFRLTTIIAILITVMGTHTIAQAASSPVLGTSKVVNLAFFYKPPEDSDASTLAQNFSTFILTRADETFRDQLIANGVNVPILQYVRIEAIMDPGSCTVQPYRDNVAYKIGDFCTISQAHPDWFLLNADGSRIKVDGKYYLMDPGNQEWREFWLSRTQESQEQLGWYGVFLDNVEASLSKVYSLGGNPANYPNDASYQAAIQGFLQYIYTSYFQPQGRPLLANIISLPDAATWFDYLQYLDGAMDEAWAVDWHTGYKSFSEWNEELNRAEQTQDNGKYAILISQGDQSNTNRQSFAFASYLLISNGKAAFRYTNYDNYGKTWLYPNYNIDLGSPIGARYQQGNLWKRDFTNGSVTVDLVNHTAQISTAPEPTATPTQPPATQTPSPTATPTEPPATQTPPPTASPTEPPATQTPEPTATFADVPPSHPLYAYIEALYQAGYTAGCSTNPLMFCPDQPMNRAMSAVFMLRGDKGAGYTPPLKPQAPFADDWNPGTWAQMWAEGMWQEGLTAGCQYPANSPTKLFCPWDQLSRVQASVFGLRMKYGLSYTPPAATGTLLADMTDVNYWGTMWAEQAYRDNLLQSCGTQGGKPMFCPNDVVNRAWAAYLVVTAKGLSLP